jgi:hypothetical protein
LSNLHREPASAEAAPIFEEQRQRNTELRASNMGFVERHSCNTRPASTGNSVHAKTGDRVMNPSREDELISLLTEIHSDLHQIKSDLQSLLTLLKQQQLKPTPSSFPNSDETPNAIESAPSGSPEDVLRYLRETRGEDDRENE